MEQTPQNPLLPGRNEETPAQSGEASGWNIGILVLIVIVLLVGIKLATWTGQKQAGETTAGAEEQAASVEQTVGGAAGSNQPLLTVTSGVPAGVGEVGLIVSSEKPVIVREIYFYNSAKTAAGGDPWVLVYDGYSQVGPGGKEIFRAQLAPITYDKVRVRTLSADSGASTESVKDIQVAVPDGASINVLLSL